MAAYTVRKGDTLSGIARLSGTDWKTLYEANRDVVGPDPNLIFPGQVLTLPGTVPGAPPSAPAAPGEPAPDAGVPAEPAAEPEFEIPDRDLETLVGNALRAQYEPQKLDLQMAFEDALAGLDAADAAARAEYGAAERQLASDRESDLARLAQDYEDAQLRMGGGYNSWLHERSGAREADLLRAYEDEMASRRAQLDATLNRSAANKALYARQLAEKIAGLDARQQAEYAARLLEMEYDQYASRKALEDQMKLAAYRKSLGSGA